MRGLELSKRYFEAAKEKLFAEFPAEKIAAGLVGEGSECFGYDDDLSVDHDFEPSFCLFVSAEDYEKFGFKLERFYAKLPKEFEGYKRSPMPPVGGRRGVLVVEDFYSRFTGNPNGPETVREWLSLPSKFLAAATNGEVFFDGNGKFCEIRNRLLAGYPENVRRKLLSSRLAEMGQAGQYNYQRAVKRGETGAAQLCINKFVESALHAAHLLNNRYCPFYKWAYKSLRSLPILSDVEPLLVYLNETPNDETTASEKAEMIENIAFLFIAELRELGWTDAGCNNLDTHALSVNYKIPDNEIRNSELFVN